MYMVLKLCHCALLLLHHSFSKSFIDKESAPTVVHIKRDKIWVSEHMERIRTKQTA